ncbi:MAG: LLM class F420-dependent oxidoreductase, partial [Candidatus Binatia bacterium]
ASLWAPEHVILVDQYQSRYPYSEDGRLPLDPSTGGMAEPLTVLSYMAARTKRVRLGTGICLVPQRNPVYTAKQVAGLDVLSHGRVDFGVGIGWLAEEFAACGVPFERRARRTLDYLEIMRRLWTEPVASFESEFYRLPPVRFEPKPVQKPHPPILFGGESDAALRRVARAGQGWFGWNLTPEAAAERIRALDRELEKRGRKRSDVAIKVCPYTHPTQDLEAMKRYRDAGVEEVVLLLFGAETAERVQGAIEILGRTVIEPAARL